MVTRLLSFFFALNFLAPASATTNVTATCSATTLFQRAADTAICPSKNVVNPSGPVTTSAEKQTLSHSATIAAAGRSEYGNLGVKSSYSLRYIAAPDSGVHNADTLASFSDVITIGSSNLPLGTSVNITFASHSTVTLSGSSLTRLAPEVEPFVQYSPTMIIGGAVAFGCVRLIAIEGCETAIDGDSFEMRLDLVIPATVGTTLSLTGMARLIHLGTYNVDGTFVTADSWGSHRIYAYADNGEISLSSASGHNYSPPAVPEASKLFQLLIGIIFVILLNRQRSNAAAAA
jgi:hypothetical protein